MHDDIIQSECGTLDSIPEATRSMPSKGREFLSIILFPIGGTGVEECGRFGEWMSGFAGLVDGTSTRYHVQADKWVIPIQCGVCLTQRDHMSFFVAPF